MANYSVVDRQYLKMILKTALILTSLFYLVHSQDLNNPKDIPVRLLDLNDVVIEDYHGAMTAKTMELFSNVETLTLSNCNFTLLNENFLHPLKNIKKIIVSNSHFDRVKSDVSICCKQLRELELYETSLGDVAEVELKKLAAMPSFERLHFSKISIPVLPSKALAGSNIKNLEIVYSNLAEIQDGALEGMNKLEVVNLKSNKLTKFPTSALAGAKTLKELNLAGNLLEKISVDDFPSLPNLEKVNIGHNPIKEINLKGLKEKLPKLKEVDVSGIDVDLSKSEGVPLIKIQIG